MRLCDLCKKTTQQIQEEGVDGCVNSFILAFAGFQSTDGEIAELELCPECRNKLEDHIRMELETSFGLKITN